MTHQALTAALLLSTLSPALAAEPAIELPPVVVTATRTAETADETLASVTVIDRAEIERKQARTVPDALRGTPGLNIANTGGRGQPTTLFLRGTDSDHVLVLIDGVKVGSPPWGRRRSRTSRSSRWTVSRWCAGRSPASMGPRPSAG